MTELKRVKVEVWFTEGQAAALAALAKQLGTPKARLARRAINYVVRGGEAAARNLRGGMYD